MGSITALCLSMKLLILAIAAISTVSASKAVTCDECQAAVTDLVARLLSEESLAEQKAILKLTVCPQLPDIDCEGTLDMWFPGLLTTCLVRRLSLRLLLISRETVSVVRMVTLRSAPLWWRLCCPWRCLSSEPPSWSSPLSSARKWSVSAKCFLQIKLKSLI